jgi:erythrocyte band 7 integral membrane protein
MTCTNKSYVPQHDEPESGDPESGDMNNAMTIKRLVTDPYIQTRSMQNKPTSLSVSVSVSDQIINPCTVSRSVKIKRKIGNVLSCIVCCTGCLAERHIPDDHTGYVVEYGIYVRSHGPGTYQYNPMTEKLFVILDTVIQENEFGIFTRYGLFVKILPGGKYPVNPYVGEKIIIRPITIINNNQIGILIREGKFIECLGEGKYQINDYMNEKILIEKEIVIQENSKGLLLKDGKFIRVLEPGKYFNNSILNEKIIVVDMRITTKELKPQTIVTKDTVTITLHSVLIYQIVDPYKAQYCIVDIDFSIRETIKIVTHQVLSEHTLDECMSKKMELSENIKQRVAVNCKDWGIAIERIDIKDIIFGEEIKGSLSAAAIAQRVADSKLITARAEVEAAKLMREAADQLDTDAAMQMRQLETMQMICKSGAKVYFFADTGMLNYSKEKINKELIKHQVNE